MYIASISPDIAFAAKAARAGKNRPPDPFVEECDLKMPFSGSVRHRYFLSFFSWLGIDNPGSAEVKGDKKTPG